MVDPLTHRYPRQLRELNREQTDWVTSVLESRFEEDRLKEMFATPYEPSQTRLTNWKWADRVLYVIALGVAFALIFKWF